MAKIHPLHDKRFIQHILDAGYMPDATRMTGRTTAQALRWIALAIENPHTPVHMLDHADGPGKHRGISDNLCHKVKDMISRLHLEHLHMDIPARALTFTRKE